MPKHCDLFYGRTDGQTPKPAGQLQHIEYYISKKKKSKFGAMTGENHHPCS